MGFTPDIRVGATRVSEGHLSILGRSFAFSKKEAIRFLNPIRDFWEKGADQLQCLTLKTVLELERQAYANIGYDLSILLGVDLLKGRRKVLEFLPRESRRDYADFLLVLASVYAGGMELDVAKKILEAVVVGDFGNPAATEDLGRIYAAQGKIAQALQRFEQARLSLAGMQRERLDEQIIEIYTNLLQATEAGEIDYFATALFFRNSFGKENDLCGMMQAMVESIGRKGVNAQRVIEGLLKKIESRQLLSFEEEQQLRKQMEGVAKEERVMYAVNLAMENFDKLEEETTRVNDDEMVKNYRAAINNLKIKSGDSDWEQVVEGLRETAIDTIRKFIADGEKFTGAIVLATALLRVDPQLKEKTARLLEDILQEDKTRILIMQKLIKLRSKAWEVAGRMPEEKGGGLMLSQAMAAMDFQRLAEIHDFFFVSFRDVTGIKELYRDMVGVPYDEPSSLNSNRYEAMANGTSEVKYKIRLLKKAVQEDRHNISARLRLIVNLGLTQEINKSEMEAGRLLQEKHNPLVDFRIYCVQVGNLCVFIRKLAKQSGNSKKIREKIAEAEKILAKAQAIIKEIDLDDPEMEFARLDWLLILRDLGLLHSLAHNPNKALGYFDQAIALNPRNEETIIIKGTSLFELGRFVEAKQLFARVIAESKGTATKSYYQLALTDFHLAQPAEALAVIDQMLLRRIRHPLYLLLAARCALSLGDKVKAQQHVEEVENFLRDNRGAIDGTGLKEVQGTLLLIKMGLRDIELIELKRREKTLDKISPVFQGREDQIIETYQQAVKLFQGDLNLEFNEMETRYFMAHILTGWGASDPAGVENYYKQAVRASRELIQKYPYFAPGHQVLIEPLVRLGRLEEALEQMEWIRGHLYGLTLDVMQNLFLLLSLPNQPKITKRAYNILLDLRKLFKQRDAEEGEVEFKKLVKIALDASEIQDREFAKEFEI